ncbi:g-type lectin s-receptor-like serine/threonine-protein kinase at4g03230, partial [Phtheirospermum japonicum]
MWALRKADKVKNETWKISVDVGFRYMIRLHFSEMGLKVAASGEVVFKVLINEIPAQTNIDLVKEKDDENKIHRYRDYVVMMRGQRKIFKLSNPDNSLAGPNPLSLAQGSQSKTTLVLLSVFRRRNAFAFVAIAVISLGEG